MEAPQTMSVLSGSFARENLQKAEVLTVKTASLINKRKSVCKTELFF